uniref:Vomeronasal type-1 receptor n=1 Tax=Rhinolophus ferrumequinum TaxID=59479 RepID=A0A671EY15_RHIFE
MNELAFHYVTINNFLIFQAVIGITTNTFLLLLHIVTLLVHAPTLTNLIPSHLALVHILTLLSVLFLVTPGLLESPDFGDDFKCQALVYMSRVMRGLSICTTCLLRTSRPSPSKSTSFVFHSFFFLWILSLSFSHHLIYTVASSNVTIIKHLGLSKYCSLSPVSYIFKGLFFMLSLFRDVFFVGIILLSSAYIVILLSSHWRQSQYLHSTSLSTRTSPEKRATQTILLLVSFFVLMYWVDFILSFSLILLWAYDPLIGAVHRLVLSVYATVSPLVVIRSDKKVIYIR